MSKTTSREIRLTSRPRGLPTADNFILSQIELGPPAQQALHHRATCNKAARRGAYTAEMESI
jgi:hypothetical protein